VCLKRDKIVSGCLIATHQYVLDITRTSIYVYTNLLSVPLCEVRSVGVAVKSTVGHKMNECQLEDKVHENSLSK
jgi:hypothetical protein